MKYTRAPGSLAGAVKRLCRWGALLLLAGWLPVQAADRLEVVTTTGMLTDAVREVGGDQVSVRGMMGSGVDPHSYRQTRSDIVAMTRADLVIWHGLYLEAQMEHFLERLARRQTVVAVAESLPREKLLAHEDYDDKFDPHVWMDPELWAEVVLHVRDALIEARPSSEQAFRDNAAAYRQDLEALSAYARRVSATVPVESRILLTAHDAFGYFGRAYDFEVVGIQGISTESETGLRRVRDMVDLLVEREVGAVFVETSVSDRNIRALVEGAGSRGHQVQVAGELYSDAMGEPGRYEGTYIGMIDHNLTTIVRALGGEAPARGMQGRLSAREGASDSSE